MDGSRLLVGLDPDQCRAVTDPGQPLCILAGAGSGKTRVLTRRIAHLAEQGSADPRYVLALTFTRRAASEMSARLGALGLRDQPTVGTFHAVAWSQLHMLARDRNRPPPVLLAHKLPLLSGLPGRGTMRPIDLAAEIEWARAREIPPHLYAHEAHRDDRRTPVPHDQIGDLYAAYEQAKADRGVVDYDDILAMVADALESDPTFAAAQRWRFRHVFVDEFQDVNPLQHRLLVQWLGDRRDLCVVGDPNQAIYRWNGADARYLLGFAARHPGSSVVELRHNYRSTPQILHLAGAALGPLTHTRLVAHRPSGDPPSITSYPSEIDEATGVARSVRDLSPPGTRWDRQAVLVRTNGQMNTIGDAFTRAGIPFRLRGADARVAAQDDLDAPRRQQDDEVDDGRSRRHPVAGDDAVDVVTFHAAKGLEWPIVHLAGLEDGLVPISHARTVEAEAEERRLLHVAVTRARDTLRLSWAEQRTMRGREVVRRPSPYLSALTDAVAVASQAVRPVDPQPGLAEARRALGAATAGDEDRVLLSALRAWRERVARAAAVPPVVILSDRVLSDIAHLHPRDVAGLATVRGIGPLTIDAYGAAVLQVVEEHGAERRAAARP